MLRARRHPVAGLLPSALLLASLPLRAAPPGNPAAGRVLFEGKGRCLDCHSVAGRGGSVGPDLSRIGLMRATASLRLSVVDPDAEILREYFTVVVLAKGGQTFRGISLNEDDLSIQIRDAEGNPRSFLKDDLRTLRRERRSLMPSYASRLSSGEIDDLVSYLHILRGPPPAPITRKREPHHDFSDVAFLDRIGRDAEERPDSLIDSLEISPGSTVADVGSGTGYFTWRLARAVGPAGKVFVVDVRQEMLSRTEEKLKAHRFTNYELVLGGETDPRLAPGTLDLVLIANAYHEFSKPEEMMAAIGRSLKPDGRLVVLEYAEGHPFGPADKTERMTMEQLRAEIEPAGFELDRVLDTVRIEHCLIFIRTAGSRN